MTICIATWCYENANVHNARIVLGTDWRISGFLGRSDTLFKQPAIVRGTYRCLIAGNPNDFRPLVKLIDGELVSVSAIDEVTAIPAIRAALNRRHRERVDEYCQAHFSMSYDELLRIGRTQLPDESYRRAISRTELIRLWACVIVAGFGKDGLPVIVRSTEDCEAFFDEGFSVIGDGSSLAQASLLSREVGEIDALEKSIYAVYEALRAATHIASVSDTRTITVLYPDGTYKVVSPNGYAKLADHYAAFGPKEIPDKPELPPDALMSLPTQKPLDT